MQTLKEMREQAKKAYESRKKDEDCMQFFETTGNKGTTVTHSWQPKPSEEMTKEEKFLAREEARERKFAEISQEEKEE